MSETEKQEMEQLRAECAALNATRANARNEAMRQCIVQNEIAKRARERGQALAGLELEAFHAAFRVLGALGPTRDSDPPNPPGSAELLERLATLSSPPSETPPVEEIPICDVCSKETTQVLTLCDGCQDKTYAALTTGGADHE